MSHNSKTSVPLINLFPDSFMNEYTKFNTFNDFLNNGNYLMNSEEDLANFDSVEFNQYISNNTQFNSWIEMYTTAGTIFVANNLAKS